jgi:hypothetical protein
MMNESGMDTNASHLLLRYGAPARQAGRQVRERNRFMNKKTKDAFEQCMPARQFQNKIRQISILKRIRHHTTTFDISQEI